MRHKTARDSTTKPDEGSLELTEDIIRVRAYQLYEERGCEHGSRPRRLAPGRGRNIGKETRCCR